MIPITRLNGSTLWISADLIETLEATPDCVVTMTTGKKIIAKESPEMLREKIIEYKRRCHVPIEARLPGNAEETKS